MMINSFYCEKAKRCFQERRETVREMVFPSTSFRRGSAEPGGRNTLGSQESLGAGKINNPDEEKSACPFVMGLNAHTCNF